MHKGIEVINHAGGALLQKILFTDNRPPTLEKGFIVTPTGRDALARFDLGMEQADLNQKIAEDNLMDSPIKVRPMRDGITRGGMLYGGAATDTEVAWEQNPSKATLRGPFKIIVNLLK